MPGKTSWHSEPPVTWLFNFNGLYQMFQAKGLPRNQNRRLPALVCTHPGSFLACGLPSYWVQKAWIGGSGRGAGVRETLQPPSHHHSAPLWFILLLLVHPWPYMPHLLILPVLAPPLASVSCRHRGTGGCVWQPHPNHAGRHQQI